VENNESSALEHLSKANEPICDVIFNTFLSVFHQKLFTTEGKLALFDRPLARAQTLFSAPRQQTFRSVCNTKLLWANFLIVLSAPSVPAKCCTFFLLMPSLGKKNFFERFPTCRYTNSGPPHTLSFFISCLQIEERERTEGSVMGWGL
jgi:hypothetical protein